MPSALQQALGMELQYSTTVTESGETLTVYDTELIKHMDLTKRQAAGYTSLIAVQDQSLRVQEQIVQIGNAVVGGLEMQANQIRANNIFWGQMNPLIAENIQLSQQQALAEIDVTQALTNRTKQQFLINNGLIEGKQAAQAWLETTIQSAAADAMLEKEMQKLVGGIEGLPPGLMLTTEQLQAFGEEMIRTGSIAETKMNVLDEAFSAGRGAIGALVDAAVEGGEEFREAWKGIDKDLFPKGEGGEIKDAINDFADVTQALEDLKLTVGTFQAMKSFGMLDEKEIAKWSGEVQEQLRGVRSEIEDLGPVGEKLGPKIVDPFLKLAKDGLTTAELNTISQFVTEFERIDAMEGPITPDQLRYLEQYSKKLREGAKDLEEWNKMIDEGIDKNHKWGESLSKQRTLTPKEVSEDAKKLPDSFTSQFPSTFGKDGGKGDKGEDPSKVFKSQTDAIRAAAQAAQTALKNLADQGSNSISILVKNSAAHVKTLDTYFRVTVPVAAQATQTSLANMGVQGSNSISLLVKAGAIWTATIRVITDDIVAWVKQNNTLARTLVVVEKDVRAVISANNILARTIVTVGKDFKSAAGDADDFASALEDVADAAKEATKQLKALKAAGGGGAVSAQGGFHTGRLEEDTIILAHKGESVDIGPGTERKRTTIREGNSGPINITIVTHNELDGERIGTTVTRKTFRNMSTR